MSTDLVHSPNPIAIPPALAEAGVTVTEEHGVRSVMIPADLAKRYNIAQPVSEVTQADPDWSPRLVVVDLSGEQFHYNEQGKRSLTKNGVLLLAHAAGIDVDVEMIPRAQLRDSEIGYKATATIRRSDGTLAHWTASKVADLDDEKAAIAGTNKKWPVEKAHLPAKTESKAILRAVSLALQLKRGGYLPAEMHKPFLIVGVSSTPADPEVRRLRALNAAGDAYGKRALPPTDETSYDDREPEPVAQLAAAPEVVDAVPVSAQPQQPAEPDPTAEPVRGEIPDVVAKAGEIVYGEGFRAKGHKVSEVSRQYLTHIAKVYEPKPEFAEAHELAIAASKAWLAWVEKQEAAA